MSGVAGAVLGLLVLWVGGVRVVGRARDVRARQAEAVGGGQGQPVRAAGEAHRPEDGAGVVPGRGEGHPLDRRAQGPGGQVERDAADRLRVRLRRPGERVRVERRQGGAEAAAGDGDPAGGRAELQAHRPGRQLGGVLGQQPRRDGRAARRPHGGRDGGHDRELLVGRAQGEAARGRLEQHGAQRGVAEPRRHDARGGLQRAGEGGLLDGHVHGSASAGRVGRGDPPGGAGAPGRSRAAPGPAAPAAHPSAPVVSR